MTEAQLESERAARLLLEELEDEGEEEIFFGPVTDKEKLKSKKMRRKTEVFRPGFRTGLDGDEEEDEDGGEEIHVGKEPGGMHSSSRELFDDEVTEVKDITRERHSKCGHSKSEDNTSGMSPSLSSKSSCPTGECSSSSGNCQSKENRLAENSGEDSKCNSGRFTQHTPSPARRRPESLESSINVNTPPLSLVTVSPQADAAVVRGDGGTCDGVELFNATECISMADCDSTAVETIKDGSSSKEKDLILEETVSGIPFAETVGLSQRQCMHVHVHVDGNSDLSDVGSKADTDSLSSLASRQEGRAVKTTGQSAVIYSSPLSISTSVQRVQMQQPICYGNSMAHIPIPVTTVCNVNIIKNLATESSFTHQADSYSSQETAVAPSALNPTGNSAFGKPIRKVDDVAASQTREFTHSQCLPQNSSSFPQSPASNAGYKNQATNSQGYCSLPSSMLHKENVNPNEQQNRETPTLGSGPKGTTYKVISAVSSPVMSALCSKQLSQSGFIDAGPASSPRVLQISNQQTTVVSPSVARQRLIDEKRALLARLRAEKQELRQRIKEDNEKCFNMKLENAAALQSNMARGMTPLFDRLPAQGCDGPAALTLTEREWEMVTKLHTIKNSQHVSTDRTQSPCHQVIQHRDHPRLHWHEDLILNIEELSSPSRPRCKAKAILSKKGQNSVRRGIGLHPSSSSLSSSSLHSRQPRARQHLLF